MLIHGVIAFHFKIKKHYEIYGSKARFTKEILLILKDRKPEQWYIEPFAGGNERYLQKQSNRIANDIHHHLIQMWRELVGGWIQKRLPKMNIVR